MFNRIFDIGGREDSIYEEVEKGQTTAAMAYGHWKNEGFQLPISGLKTYIGR